MRRKGEQQRTNSRLLHSCHLRRWQMDRDCWAEPLWPVWFGLRTVPMGLAMHFSIGKKLTCLVVNSLYLSCQPYKETESGVFASSVLQELI